MPLTDALPKNTAWSLILAPKFTFPPVVNTPSILAVLFKCTAPPTPNVPATYPVPLTEALPVTRIGLAAASLYTRMFP